MAFVLSVISCRAAKSSSAISMSLLECCASFTAESRGVASCILRGEAEDMIRAEALLGPRTRAPLSSVAPCSAVVSPELILALGSRRELSLTTF
jgi:hypothetical protein